MELLFAAPSDLAYPFWQRAGRFFLKELAFLPWKIIPFYLLFYYLLPRYFSEKKYLQIAGYFSLCLLLCVFGYRSTIGPAIELLYGEEPSFGVYDPKRWLYSLLIDMLPALMVSGLLIVLVAGILRWDDLGNA